MSVTQLSERKKEPTPFQRFETALRAAVEAEGCAIIDEEFHRATIFLARWFANNAPFSECSTGDDWRNSMAEGE